MMENRTIFFVAAGGLAAFTILNLMRKTDIVTELKPAVPRVDYFQKGQNSSAKKINLSNLTSYIKVPFKKKLWTQSATKADRAKLLTASHSADKSNRNVATEMIAKHALRTGSGHVGPASRIYNYYG